MKSKRRLFWCFAAVVVAVGMAGFACWLARPMPYRQAFDHLTIGMAEADAVALVPSLMELDGTYLLHAIEWHGLLDGTLRQARIQDIIPSKDNERLSSNPVYAQSRMDRLPKECDEDNVDEGVVIYRDRNSGRAVATERQCNRGPEALYLMFIDGRLVEKAYCPGREIPSRWERFQDAIEKWWLGPLAAKLRG